VTSSPPYWFGGFNVTSSPPYWCTVNKRFHASSYG
jgi:hypothetical protein